MEGWYAAPSFAEQAEALELTTSHIVAVAERAEVVTYVHDPESEDLDQPVFAAVLLRSYADGILGSWISEIPTGSTLGQIRAVAVGRHGLPEPPPDDPT